MVRVNLISPSKLSDQHLIAEYNEILMLVGYARKHPELMGIPESYRLGTGHIKFFKNKIGYLKKRHELIKTEMARRNFSANKTVFLKGFGEEYFCEWKPGKKDFEVIKARISEKIKMKPEFYRYYSECKGGEFFLNLLK